MESVAPLFLFHLSTAPATPTATRAPDESDETISSPVPADGDENADGRADLAIAQHLRTDSPELQSWVCYSASQAG